MRNGLGHVRKLSGNRRKPYAAIVTVGYEYGEKQQDISFLKPVLTDEEYNDLLERYTKYCDSQPKSRQIQKYIGYYATKREGYLALSEYYQKPLDLKGNNITFAEAWEYVKVIEYKDLSDNTQYIYDAAYKKLSRFYSMQVRNITRLSIEKFMEENSNLSKSYLNCIMEIFRKVFAYCTKNKFVQEDISRDISINSTAEKKVKRAIPIDDIISIKNSNNRYLEVYTLLTYTGMRVSELLSLKKEDVHLDERYISLQGTKTASAVRLIPIHKDIQPLVEKCLKTDSDYLVCNTHGRKYTYQPLMREITSALKGLGIDYYTPHECRHTFSSLWTKNRLDETLRKKIMGHKTNDITIDVYTHVYIEDIVAEIDKMVVH